MPAEETDNLIKYRYEFSLLIEAENGNPNGDPDALGSPRVDDETGIGIITDVCTKYKIRNYIKIKKENESGFRIFIDDDMALNDKQANGYIQANGDEKTAEKLKKEEARKSARDWMCQEYYDIRAFGAMMSTGTGNEKLGNVVGPVQIAFGRSMDPINPAEFTLTRNAVTKQDKFEAQDRKGTFATKYLVPYGLYRINGYINPVQARKTGFSEADLELLWEALETMYEFDRSAMRGDVHPRKLVVFKHESYLGNAPARKVLDSLKIQKKDDVEYPRSYDDYFVDLDETAIPERVEVILNHDL